MCEYGGKYEHEVSPNLSFYIGLVYIKNYANLSNIYDRLHNR